MLERGDMLGFNLGDDLFRLLCRMPYAEFQIHEQDGRSPVSLLYLALCRLVL
jgi:hypothetical protein